MPWPARLSLNLQTTLPHPLNEVLDACDSAGVRGIGLYQPANIEPLGLSKAVDLVHKAGIPVTIYAAVGGWVSGFDFAGKPCNLARNISILDEAVELGVPCVSVLGGGLLPHDRDLDTARGRIVTGLTELAPYAEERGLRLALEPLHPAYGPDKDVILTLHHALDLLDQVPFDSVGVVVDTYHQWWEPDLVEQLRRAVTDGRVCVVQVSDWSPALEAKKPFSRALMGDGCIDFATFAEGLRDYDGPFELEVLRNDELMSLPVSEILQRVRLSYEVTLGRLIAANQS